MSFPGVLFPVTQSIFLHSCTQTVNVLPFNAKTASYHKYSIFWKRMKKIDRDLNGIPTDYRRFIHRISTQDNLLVFNDRGNIIVIMPQNLQEEVLRYSHCDWSSGPFGIFKTHRRVLERFWWPKLYRHVEALISTFELCQKTKTSGQMGL